MRNNNIIALSALEDGLTHIERYYRENIKSLVKLINQIINDLPQQPCEQWIFAHIFIEAEIKNHEAIISDSLRELSNTLNIDGMQSELNLFANKLRDMLQNAIEKTPYRSINGYAKFLAERNADKPLVTEAQRIYSRYRR